MADAIRYAVNQKVALLRFFDGSLPMHNNVSELNLRRQVVGRMKPSRRHAQIHLPPLDAGYALTLVDIFDRAIDATWPVGDVDS